MVISGDCTYSAIIPTPSPERVAGTMYSHCVNSRPNDQNYWLETMKLKILLEFLEHFSYSAISKYIRVNTIGKNNFFASSGQNNAALYNRREGMKLNVPLSQQRH